jgi:hypothetical protein
MNIPFRGKIGIGYKDRSSLSQAETPDLSVAALMRMLYFVPVENTGKQPLTENKEIHYGKTTVFCSSHRRRRPAIRLYDD